MRAKVWTWHEGALVPLESSRLFERESFQGTERLVVSSDREWTELAVAVLLPGGDNFYCLHESLMDTERTRTQSRALTQAQLTDLVSRYKEFIETDPCHAFWLYNVDSETQVVIDEHNLLFIYGDLASAATSLKRLGFTRGTVRLPTPHVHLYDRLEPDVEAALLSELRQTR